ncbi:MAG: tetratricopeptide repeat protein [Sphingobacteriaceae bacterium]|nr:tetratricopeptide repeat protein [Sphingobacteriaceae bacterium]
MFRFRNSLAVLFIFFSLSTSAKFDFNPNCVKAYKEIFGLKLKSARTLIETEKKINPQNAIPYLLDSYVDYFTIITSESIADFERLKRNKAARLARIEKDDKSSPYYLFAQAEIHLQWALTYGYFEEYFNSSIELNKAYRQLQDNAKKFPGFLPNQKNIAILDAVIGALPVGLKRAISVIGIKGNTQKGIKTLENLLISLPQSPYAHFYDDVVFLLAYVQTDIVSDHSSYPKILAYAQKIDSSSLLKSYIISYSAMRTAHTEVALATLNNRPAGPEYQNYDYLDYMAGTIRMRKLDHTATSYFQSYLHKYKGINYIKDTYLNLAWIALINGNKDVCKKYIELVKTKGNAIHDKDKQALQEINDPMPDVDLLKARLLCDGGYYTKALAEIKDKRITDLKHLRDRIELFYRLGRIYDELNQDDLSIKFYQSAMDMGKEERYYFASNAALRLAAIYEKKKDHKKAREFYQIALDMDNHDYERSTDSKAKEGLRRTGG